MRDTETSSDARPAIDPSEIIARNNRRVIVVTITLMTLGIAGIQWAAFELRLIDAPAKISLIINASMAFFLAAAIIGPAILYAGDRKKDQLRNPPS